MTRERPWVRVALSGVITLLPGLLIQAGWPVNSLCILGLFLSFDLIVAGASWTGGAGAIAGLRQAVRPSRRSGRRRSAFGGPAQAAPGARPTFRRYVSSAAVSPNETTAPT
jgi:hypothetical protein